MYPACPTYTYIFSFANAILKFTLLPRKILLLKRDCKRNKSVLQLHNVSWNVVSRFTASTLYSAEYILNTVGFDKHHYDHYEILDTY